MAENAQSETDLCNQALSLSGNSRIINLAEENERARVCRLLYPRTRDETQAHSGVTWNICKARAELSETTEPAFGWDHAFTLPPSPPLLRVIAQVSELRQLQIFPWAREADVLLTNQTSCFIHYVTQITNTAKFPPLLYEATYTNLASKLATRLSKNPKMAESLLFKYLNDVLPRAIAANAEETYYEGQEGNNNWIEHGRFTDFRWPPQR